MDFSDLGKDRFLKKDPNQSDQTKDAAYAAGNPAPKGGDDSRRKIGRPSGSEEDNGAPNILTGTVIISCFIQTSALPSRVEMQGNDITFFDDTTSVGGEIKGDTSRLVFTHASGKSGEVITQGFILEKRASIRESYDNVLSWYATPAKEGFHNNMFIGRNGTIDELRNLNSLYLAVRKDINATAAYPASVNGVWGVEYSESELLEHPTQRPFAGGNSDGVLGTTGQTGFSSLMSAGDGGGLYWAYKNPLNADQWIIVLAADNTQIAVGASVIPTVDNTYDLGSASFRFRNIYGTLVGPGSSAAYNPTLTGTPAIGATSATLSSAWPGSTDSRICMFQNGDIRLVNFTNGGTALNWSIGLSAGAGGNQIFTYN